MVAANKIAINMAGQKRVQNKQHELATHGEAEVLLTASTEHSCMTVSTLCIGSIGNGELDAVTLSSAV